MIEGVTLGKKGLTLGTPYGTYIVEGGVFHSTPYTFRRYYMARTKRSLIIRREGVAITEHSTPNKKTYIHAVGTIRKPVLNAWGMTKKQAREATPAPTRSDLTQSQWQEWGDGVRALKTQGYHGADLLCLNDLRDAVCSIAVCTNLRVCA